MSIQLYTLRHEELANKLAAGEARLESFIERMPEKRQIRYLESTNYDYAMRCLAGAWLLEQALGDAINKIQYNPYGKPYLENGSFFNLSHCTGQSFLAVANDALGLDCEKLQLKEIVLNPKEAENKFANLEEITEASLHPLELALWQKEPTLLNFIKFWTIKESWLKFLGKGISIDPRTFAILPKEDNFNNEFYLHLIEDQELQSEVAKLKPCYFYHTLYSDSICLALCLAEKIDAGKIDLKQIVEVKV